MDSDARTVAWILYAVALASGVGPVSFAGLSSVADGINHAVPTQQEISTSLRWLRAHGLVQSAGKRHALTDTGRSLLEEVSANASTMSGVWAHLTQGIRLISAGPNNSFKGMPLRGTP